MLRHSPKRKAGDDMNYKIEQYLDTVCNWLPTIKLRRRTRNELTEHFEDILDDYEEQGIEEEEAVNRAIEAMGDPNELHKKLKKAHKDLLFYVRLRNLVILLLVLFLFFKAFNYIRNELYIYCRGTTFEQAEKALYEDKTYINEEIKFLCEQEYNGKIYYIYYSKNIRNNKFTDYKDNYDYCLYTVETVHAFGRDFHDKFIYTSQYGEVRTVPSIYNDILYTTIDRKYYKFVEPMDAEYFTVDLIPLDRLYGKHTTTSHSDMQQSEFYKMPKTPGAAVIEAPDGFQLSSVRMYDENKQEIPR